jgi:proteasome activator subunit 3 (PA28 gamma)
MAADVVARDVSEFKEKIKREAEELVLRKFPKQMLELNALLTNDKFMATNMVEVYQDVNIPVPEAPPPPNNHEDGLDTEGPQTKKRRFAELGAGEGSRVLVLPNGASPSNKYLCEMISQVKPKIRQLVEDANLLKMWILFLIPRIEDGNNFGVSIQEDTLGEIRTVESEAAAYFDQISRYFLSRGKIVAKIAKYPHVEDFRRTLAEIDEKQFLSLRLVVAELRNHYATLHDIITKNLEKIRKPRTSNNENMY